MQRSEEEDEARRREQERKEREAAEAAEAAEEAALAEEEEALAATEEARAVESLEKQNEASEGKVMNAHMLGAPRPSVTMVASEPNTPIFGPSTTAAGSVSAATAAGSTSASASAVSTVWLLVLRRSCAPAQPLVGSLSWNYSTAPAHMSGCSGGAGGIIRNPPDRGAALH